MPNDRREFLTGTALAAVATAAPGVTPSGASPGRAAPAMPDLSFLQTEPLLHRERATRLLEASGLDALVVSAPANVHYCTNHWPLSSRMSVTGACYAVVPRLATLPVTLIAPLFSFYYTMMDDGLPRGVVGLVHTPEADTPALTRYLRLDDDATPSPRERRRRERTEAARPFEPDARRALGRALREAGATRGRVGIDDLALAAELAAVSDAVTTVPAADLLRHIRYVKSPAEIRLMRIAAAENAAAALAAARGVREHPTLRGLRGRYFAELAARGGAGVFMVVDMSSSVAYDEPLRDGQWLMIDCVGHFANYHGDYGRTLCLGEPDAAGRRAASALSVAWDDIRTGLRPGMSFAAIRSRGAAALARHGYDYSVGFNVHSVGLWHSDQPRAGLDGRPVDLVLEPGVVLSVDCPLTHAGLGGSAHLEDLVLITAAGAELLNDPGERLIVV
jgi:Xaa-Pro aminopeptidase